MKNIFGRNLLMMLMVGLGLALTPGTARAEFLDFTVDETTVTGTGGAGFIFTADEIEGRYVEIISFDGAGGFEATIIASFANFSANEGTDIIGQDIGDSQLVIGSADPDEYRMYAVYIASGDVIPSGPGTFSFTTDTVTATLYIDPGGDTIKSLPAVGGAAPTIVGGADDYDLLTVSSVYFESNTLISGVGGFFDIRFDDPSLSTCAPASTECGEAFFPDLSILNLRATIDGDFDEFDPTSTSPVESGGQLSVNFTAVPEPASLTLLGLGLLGSGLAARRRRTV